MGPVSAVRSQVQTSGTSPLPAVATIQGASAARNGDVARPAAPPATAFPVQPAAGAARADLALQSEGIEGRAEEDTVAAAAADAAREAYIRASIAAGILPLPLP